MKECLHGTHVLRANLIGVSLAFLAACLIAGHPALAQRSPDAAKEDLQAQLQSLSQSVGDMQRQLTQSQAEIDALKSQVAILTQALIAEKQPTSSQDVVASLQAAVSDLKDQDQVLQSELKQHEQTKLETASKYPVNVTGLLLFSSFLNNGAVDTIDDPVLAEQRTPGAPIGSLAATMRQTILGLDARGPQIWGAKSSADLRVDFFGGLSYEDYDTSSGILRLRTAHAQLDWPQHSLIFAFDKPLISPNSPTSLLAAGEPALAWSGNLWTWSPQLEIKNHTPIGSSTLNYDFALIDASAPGPPSSAYLRQPDAAEQSRQPGYELHTGYAFQAFHANQRPLEIGAGAYYSRHTYTTSQHVDAWTAATDWLLPISQRLELSGAFYRGRALGGLGGGGFKDVVTNPTSGAISGLDAEGGWTQLKLRFSPLLEANIAFGQDTAFADKLYNSVEGASTDLYNSLARNRAGTANLIFRPKTYLLFSSEFRYLESWPITGTARTAPVVGFGAGYQF